MGDRRCAVGLAAALALIAALAAPVRAADIAGTWVGLTEVPDQGPDVVTMVITKVEGGFSVVMSDSLGVVVKDPGVRDVKLENDVLTFLFTINDGSVLTMRLKVAGDKMTGQWEHPEGDIGTIAFERKK